MSAQEALRPAHGVVPARYASSRFPGKPLTLLRGMPMFWHVWQRASLCSRLASVTLATDDERIKRAAEELGVPVLMTSSHHASGTDRVHEAAGLLGLAHTDLVVNIQGDEPALDPACLTQLLEVFDDPSVRAATLAYPMAAEDLGNPDKVKVVRAANGDALYFSRAAIPFDRDGHGLAAPLGHMGIYAFTMEALDRFVAMPPSPLELTEKLEQLRLLENGIALRVALTEKAGHGVDTRADVGAALKLMGS